MKPETAVKIQRISRYLYIYASILIIGLLWNILDGEIESFRDFFRGIVRAAVMVYLSKSIWDLRKVSWWVISCASCAFSFFGVFGSIFSLIAGAAIASSELFFLGIVILPATIILVKTFLLSIQKDVREQFTN